MKKNLAKWNSILSFTAILLAVLLVNILSQASFFRIDLTEEKRFTLSDATTALLENIEGEVYIEVFLEGNLNAEFTRLKAAIKETLDEFVIYSEGKINYEFTNPNAIPNPRDRNNFFKQLTSKGLPPTTLFDVVSGERKQMIIFPGALISYQNKEIPVLFLKGNKGSSPQDQLNQSIEGIEYEIASGLFQISNSSKKTIGFVEDHGELSINETISIYKSLEPFFSVERVQLKNLNPEYFDALVIAQPKSKFSEIEKYKLDQFIMAEKGALFLLDKVQMNIDSIPIGGTYAFPFELNIEDLLFKYGVRVNNNLIQDLQASKIDIVVGQKGNQPNIQALPWPYYIYLNSYNEHVITRNLDAVLTKFVSSIDTVKAEGVKKTPLITTSIYSRVKNTPNRISLDEIRNIKEEKALFNQKNIPVAYLLEGKLRSLYENRFLPRGMDRKDLIKSCKEGKVLVIADGDIIKNEINNSNGKVIPLDFDKYRNDELDNTSFLLNALFYLTDENGIISARNKSVTMRPLDRIKVREEKEFWQLVNILVPVLLGLVYGVFHFYYRKKKYMVKQ